MNRSDMRILLAADRDGRTLTVSDNGIGMDAEELDKNLGVIASSGSRRFREEMAGKELPQDDENAGGLIGQFGVGFYSAFMVADRVTVLTRKYGADKAYKWESSGADGYTVSECEKEETGTDVILHLRPDGEEKNEFSAFLGEYKLRELVRKYSDYVRYPIRMLVTREKQVEGSDPEHPEYEEVTEYETLNSMRPLWHRKKGEVTEEEYNEFYQSSFLDMEAPLSVIPVSAEGTVQYEALLFIPAKAPALFGTDDYKPGLELYSEGVKIMDRCEDLLPDWLAFVRGMVDSPDLSLNISRELLQHDRNLKTIRTHLEKKVRGELERMLKDDREKYEKFFKGFGRWLKICALNDYGARKNELADLMLFHSSKNLEHGVTLSEYVENMKPDQKYIYFASGTTLENIDRLPQIELLKERDIEVLYFPENVDGFFADVMGEYKEKKFRSAVDGDLELDGEKKAEDAGNHQELLDFVKETLGDRVDEVKVSDKLKSHPVALSSGSGITFDMEQYFKTVNPEMGMKARRVLELNVDHSAVTALSNAMALDKEKAKKYAEILYNQACLIAGLPLDDPSGYTDLLVSLW